MDILKQTDIDALLKQMEELSKNTSIIEITPKDIMEIQDPVVKSEKQKQFNCVEFLYVNPLKKLLKGVLSSKNEKNYLYDINNLSILDRIKKLGRVLLNYGYTKQQLVMLVPHTKEEVNIVLEAKEKGFIDLEIVDHVTRLSNAKKWLGYEELNKQDQQLHHRK